MKIATMKTGIASLALLPGLMLQPGVQLIVNPGGNPATPNALALGLNAVVSF